MDYRSAIDQLLTLADFERKSRANEPPDFHLRRMELLLSSLGQPHLAVPVVHVAGSKGKGSVCSFIASALAANGLRTGLYTSPHLHRFTERIRIDGVPVEEDDFASLVERLWPNARAIELRGGAGVVSVFEMLTAMAFVHFREVAADCAVIEVGLGGRLDATNLVQPEVSVITPVGLDHVATLGDSIAKIAYEKAGIIKPHSPAVSSPQHPDAAEVIRRKAAETGSPLRFAPDVVQMLEARHRGSMPQAATFIGARGRYEVEIPLLGEHQLENAMTAIAALESLGGEFAHLDAGSISSGLSGVEWPLRAEAISDGPPVILADGAHNADSGLALLAAIGRHFGGHRDIALIIGATGGHDVTAVARALSPLKPRLVATRSRHPKAVPVDEFTAALKRDNVEVENASANVAEALETALRLSGPDTLIVAAGSLFIAAEVKEAVQKIEPELYPDLRGPLTQAYEPDARI